MTALVMLRALRASVAVFLRDVFSGLLQVSHNTLALLGLTVVAVLAFGSSHADLRHEVERAALGWLQSRHEARAEREGNLLVTLSDPQGVARATATDPKELDRQQAAVAKWLAGHAKVTRVIHPTLAQGRAADLAAKYLPRGAGGLVGFELAGGAQAGRAFIDGLKLFYHVANIGDARSLAIHPASTTHSQLSEAEQAAAGVSPGYVRLSIGIEHIDDILADLDQALAGV